MGIYWWWRGVFARIAGNSYTVLRIKYKSKNKKYELNYKVLYWGLVAPM